MGLLYLAREVAPAMIEAAAAQFSYRKHLRASWQGKLSGFAADQGGQRISIGIDRAGYSDRAVSRGLCLIDSVIDVPRMRERLREAPDAFLSATRNR